MNKKAAVKAIATTSGICIFSALCCWNLIFLGILVLVVFTWGFYTMFNTPIDRRWDI